MPTDDMDEPQPFTHLSVPNVRLYRSALRTLARAKERFIVHLRPEDVAAELRVDAEERGASHQYDGLDIAYE